MTSLANNSPALAPASTGTSVQLRDFFTALAGLMDGSAGALPDAVCKRLMLGVTDVLTDLRTDVDRYSEAIAGLRGVTHNSLLPSSPAIADALAEMERSRETAQRLLASFSFADEGYASQSARPAPALQAIVPTSQAYAWPENPLLLEDGADAAIKAEKATPEESTHRSNRIVQSDEEHAAELVAEAESLQRQEKLDRAESLFSDAILFDPANAAAWSGRGDVRLSLGSPSDAIGDYVHALRLQPEGVRTRFHFAVAQCLVGNFRRAITEFTQVIQVRPDWARAYLNRGIAYRALDEIELAHKDFTSALSHDPKCDKAREFLNADDEPVEDVEVVDKAPTPKPIAPPPTPKPIAPAPPKPAASAETKREIALPAPKLPAAPVLKKRTETTSGHFIIACPYCGHEGAVSWNRLNHAMLCKCGQKFGVNGEGQAVRLVVGGNGILVDEGRQRRTNRRQRYRRLTLAASLLLMLLVPTIAIASWRARHPAVTTTEAPLPTELSARAELFTQAWMSGDVRTMKRLTSPPQEKEVYVWSLRAPPPAGLRSDKAGTPPEGVRVAVATRTSNPNYAVLDVRASTSPDDPKPVSTQLVQNWENRGGTWYFVPPQPVRARR